MRKVIEESHPCDPHACRAFGLAERITVRNFYLKLLDVFNCYNLEDLYLRLKKAWKKPKKQPLNEAKNQNTTNRPRGDKNRLVRPESLKNVADPGSSSDSVSEEERRLRGLTLATVSLDEGSALYLQTMKTLFVMFVALSFLNIPVYNIY